MSRIGTASLTVSSVRNTLFSATQVLHLQTGTQTLQALYSGIEGGCVGWAETTGTRQFAEGKKPALHLPLVRSKAGVVLP